MNSLLSFIKTNWKYILLIFIAWFYLTFPMILTYDSAHYMGYVQIFENVLPFSTWDIVRGPVFPILIHLSNLFFGKTSNGIVLFSFIFYLIMLFVSSKIIKEFSQENKKVKIVLTMLFFLLVVFNIIVFGYYHTLLTEFVAMTISVISCYLSWKLLLKTTKGDKKHYFLLMLCFVIMVPFSWFLKQPYVSITLFPLIISTIISLFTSRPIKRFLPHFAVLLLSIVSLFVGIFAWNKVLEKKGLETDTSRSAFNILGQGMIDPLENYEILEDVNTDYLEKAKFLSFDEREMLNSAKENFKVVEVYNTKGTLIDQMLVKTKENGFISSEYALKFIIKAFFTHPLETLNSYVVNYWGIVNAYHPWTLNSAEYYIDKDFNLLGCQENCGIATIIGQTRSNIFYIPENMAYRIQDYEQSINSPFLFRLILNGLKTTSIVAFNVSLFLLPFVLLVIILYLILAKKISRNKREIMYLSIILLGYSFLHICAHSVISAVIDRYASPAYITAILGYFGIISLLLYNTKHEKRYKK